MNTCKTCNGSGEVAHPSTYPPTRIKDVCPDCDGSGYLTAKPAPSAEAIALAVKLSGHGMCERGLERGLDNKPCDGCLGDAATIDHELQLPARNAALLCAQGVLDAYERYDDKMDCWAESTLNELRDVLARIGKK